MKYAIIILEGAADRPCDDLDGLTPLQSAQTPRLDELSKVGRFGLISLIPRGLPLTPDVAALTLFGYNATETYGGWAGLEAAAFGIELGEYNWALRSDLITVDHDGTLVDHTAGRIGGAETTALFHSLAAALPHHLEADVDGIEFFPIGGNATLMVDRGDRMYHGIKTTPPWQALGDLTVRHEPRGDQSARLLRDIMSFAADQFDQHEVNLTRREMGEREATMPWFWGPGQRTLLPPWAGSRGHEIAPRTAIVGGPPMMRGLARLMGWEWIDTEATTGRGELWMARSGSFAAEALDECNLIVAHDDAPRLASHDGDTLAKIEAIEQADQDLIGPVIDRLRGEGDDGWRFLLTTGPVASVADRKLIDGVTPVLMAGHRIESILQYDTFSESQARESDLQVSNGADFLEYFMFSGLPGSR